MIVISGERRDREIYYQYTSFLEPSVNLAYDLEPGASSTLDASSLDFDPAPYVTEQLFAMSRDGTAVPLVVVRRRDIELDGSHPVLLWGYGGLLVGTCITRRPELFAAAHASVGVFDMLCYQEFTIGWAWAGDFGTSDDEEEFAVLYAYSPLHNVKDGTCYPATLLTTGDHDDRVVPGHSFKFAARLQHAQGCRNPVLLRVETRTGHGAGKPTSLLIEEQADVLSFLLEYTIRTRR